MSAEAIVADLSEWIVSGFFDEVVDDGFESRVSRRRGFAVPVEGSIWNKLIEVTSLTL